jgi:hypothetical protein
MTEDLTPLNKCASGSWSDPDAPKVPPTSITTFKEFVSEDIGTLHLEYELNSEVLELGDNEWEAYGCCYSTNISKKEAEELYEFLGSYLGHFND